MSSSAPPPLGDASVAPSTTASENIPMVALPFVSDKAKKMIDLVENWVQEECIPADAVYTSQLQAQTSRWIGHPSILETMKDRAKKLGIWNMFLPKNHFANEGSPGFTNLEYGLMAEQLGKSRIASEACNCAAPDTGNMEVIARYGNAEQKQKWLRPLLDGKIRSGFLMTEPDVASSDGSNIALRMERRGNEYVLNGSKWWSSGAGDDRCRIFIVMGKTDPGHKDPFKRQSMMLVPADSEGLTVHRMLSVYGYDDAPHGHGHLSFKDVRVPLDAVIMGEGKGNEIMQGRLGPGRIHHAMRAIGAAEIALEWMINRLNDDRKIPFGKPLREHGVLLEWVAKSRMEIDASRLVVLNAAIKIDAKDAKFALKEIAEAKVMVPNMALTVIDRAVQVHGAMGVCQDTPLASMWAHIRTLRIADGPDEAHLQQIGKRENRQRRDEVMAKIKRQAATSDKMFRELGIKQIELGAEKFQKKELIQSKL